MVLFCYSYFEYEVTNLFMCTSLISSIEQFLKKKFSIHLVKK
ncbi:hypothetical protein IFVP408_C290414 [Vibrio parahaemolyticus]